MHNHHYLILCFHLEFWSQASNANVDGNQDATNNAAWANFSTSPHDLTPDGESPHEHNLTPDGETRVTRK